ncbi:MAG: hypothetical protein EBW04_06065, partial [Betaproteobacteria bacterium]|nr:hypothetical protein [Betaproteobacteria bacterium]
MYVNYTKLLVKANKALVIAKEAVSVRNTLLPKDNDLNPAFSATFISASEIIAFDKKVAEFKERNVELLGVSIDSKFSHYAWRETAVDKGGIGQVKYPLIADITKNIARDYGVLINEAVAIRGLFLIDKDGIVRHSTINDLPLGRNV